VRVTGGTSKGLQLSIPKKYRIRPTTDRVREAIFSILASMGGEWSRCLDLYAGSGALGIEALSRDAQWTDFVDQEPRCCAIIKQNLEKVGFANKAHVYCCNVSKALTFLDDKYDIIFIDPPYSDSKLENLIMQVDKQALLNKESLVVIPHSSRTTLSERYGDLHLIKQKQHGDTCISIYLREVEN
jgi:16S rRNA (guanine966-N2)-methyltransferase